MLGKMCCICQGSCTHEGPHSYCSQHSVHYPQGQLGPYGYYYHYPYGYYPYWYQNWPQYTPVSCDHCYCEEGKNKKTGQEIAEDHVGCCKCRNRMHKKFLVFKAEK